MHRSVYNLIDLLTLEKIDAGLYRGTTSEEDGERVYGGLVLSQAFIAVTDCCPADRLIHSLHANFLRSGNTSLPIFYQVEVTRSGRNFTVCQVQAKQKNSTIFQSHMSLHTHEEGLSHQMAMPEAPAPEALPLDAEIFVQNAKAAGVAAEQMTHIGSRHIEIRSVAPLNGFTGETSEPLSRSWMRTAVKLPDNNILHHAAVVYMSDWSLLDVGTFPHGTPWYSEGVQIASLDHGIWLHQPITKADQWLLFVQDSPAAAGGRTFNRGLVFNQSGELVASTAQEALFRSVHEQAST